MGMSDIESKSSESRGERFIRLFIPAQRRIYGFILSLIPSRADADDLMQETGSTLWRKFDEYRDGTDFAAWALAVARIEVLRYRQRAGRSHLRFDSDVMETLVDDAAAITAELSDRREALEQCLDSLPDDRRAMVRMRYERDLSPADVAKSLGKNIATVYKTLNRTHGALLDCVRRRLAEEAT